MQKCKNAELIPSRSCDAIAHTSHEMHSAPLAKCEEKEEAERRRHDQFRSWCVAKGTSMSTRDAKMQNAKMQKRFCHYLSRSCDAIAHTSHEMHSAPLA